MSAELIRPPYSSLPIKTVNLYRLLTRSFSVALLVTGITGCEEFSSTPTPDGQPIPRVAAAPAFGEPLPTLIPDPTPIPLRKTGEKLSQSTFELTLDSVETEDGENYSQQFKNFLLESEKITYMGRTFFVGTTLLQDEYQNIYRKDPRYSYLFKNNSVVYVVALVEEDDLYYVVRASSILVTENEKPDTRRVTLRFVTISKEGQSELETYFEIRFLTEDRQLPIEHGDNNQIV